MISLQRMFLISVFLMVTLTMWIVNASAQTVEVSINASEYDVLFLTDLFNVKTQRISPTVSSFSVDLIGRPGATLRISVEVIVQVKLRGDAGFVDPPLVQGISADFDMKNGRRTLTAIDFAANGIANANAGKYYYQNSTTKRKIAELAQTSSTAPPGTYQITVIVHPAGVTALGGAVIGKDTKTIVIPYSSVDEVFVEINDPKNGSFFTNLAPTFSWTSSEKDVRVSVYEAGLNHHSPQDVLTAGNPCLIWKSYNDNIGPGDAAALTSTALQSQPGATNFSGTSLTYPSNAQRQLQKEKAYVLQVEARVNTNRGPMMRPSRPVVFRIADDEVGKILDGFVNTLDNKISSPYFALRSDPTNWIFWPQYGNIMLDGSKLTETDLQTILKDLASRKDIKIEIDIENQ